METVFSNFAPANITPKSLKTVWSELFGDASEVLIATGYVSNDAVEELHAILRANPEHIKNLQLLVGMHYLEGFTKAQYDSLINLQEYLTVENRGCVYISEFIKFHGKLYSFANNQKVEGLIGSANFSCFWNSAERTYETMLHISQKKEANTLLKNINDLIDKLGKPINEVPKPNTFITHNKNLEEQDDVHKVEISDVLKLVNTPSEFIFSIPLKTTEKSNLNVFFGQGRRDQRGIIIPRPWYEVELIVSSNITNLDGYPRNKEFTVITDDGWRFDCKTSGDYSKNFRSKDNLKTLGKWIKGKLELSGALETGQMVTNEVLDTYGCKHVELRSTSNPDEWLLSYKGKD